MAKTTSTCTLNIPNGEEGTSRSGDYSTLVSDRDQERETSQLRNVVDLPAAILINCATFCVAMLASLTMKPPPRSL